MSVKHQLVAWNQLVEEGVEDRAAFARVVLAYNLTERQAETLQAAQDKIDGKGEA